MLMKLRATYLNLVTALFIFLFLYTAISKVMQFDTFRQTLSRSPLVGSYADAIAIAVPVIEVLVSGLLFFPFTHKAGLYGSLLLMLIFSAYLGYMICFAKDLPCSCGGVLQDLSWQQHLWFNLFFTILAATGIYICRPKRPIKSLLQ
jgi:hypothetical protein